VSNPFVILGLTPETDPTDDDVRSAWRRVAAATHPDRADGGDSVAFAAAAAAYTALRTAASRREAIAELRQAAVGQVASDPVPARKQPLVALAAGAIGRIGHGRPARLAARLLTAVAAAALAVTVIGWQPSSLAVSTGALTWLLLTGRRDLAARKPRR
jgi:curved DNA-binding protein CbpA